MNKEEINKTQKEIINVIWIIVIVVGIIFWNSSSNSIINTEKYINPKIKRVDKCS